MEEGGRGWRPGGGWGRGPEARLGGVTPRPRGVWGGALCAGVVCGSRRRDERGSVEGMVGGAAGGEGWEGAAVGGGAVSAIRMRSNIRNTARVPVLHIQLYVQYISILSILYPQYCLSASILSIQCIPEPRSDSPIVNSDSTQIVSDSPIAPLR